MCCAKDDGTDDEQGTPCDGDIPTTQEILEIPSKGCHRGDAEDVGHGQPADFLAAFQVGRDVAKAATHEIQDDLGTCLTDTMNGEREFRQLGRTWLQEKR